MARKSAYWITAGSVIMAAGLVLDTADVAADIGHENQFGAFVIQASLSSAGVVQGAILGDVFEVIKPERPRTGLGYFELD